MAAIRAWLAACCASAMAVAASPPRATRLRITNGCGTEPLWVAHMAAGPDEQDIRIEPRGAHDFTITDRLSSTRYWPKFRCNAQGGACTIGQSGGPGEDCDPMLGCAPPVDTKFEATFGVASERCDPSHGHTSGCDWVDVSLVDGFTVPFRVDMRGCDAAGSTRTVDCSGLNLHECPASEDLGVAGRNVSLLAVAPWHGEAIGCYSPCSKLTFQNWGNPTAKGRTPQDAAVAPYCCPTPPESPEACRAGPVRSTKFVDMVHRRCPGVYGFSYDDGVGLLTCQAGTAYEVTFYCPDGLPPTPSPTPPPPSPPSPGRCHVGDSVPCPGSSANCAGNQCCPNGSTCPSADDGFHGCPEEKHEDCTKENTIML